MKQSINKLTGEHLIQTLSWNATYPLIPTTVHQAHLYAKSFFMTEKPFRLAIERRKTTEAAICRRSSIYRIYNQSTGVTFYGYPQE